jgi:hypothetical protein
MMISHRCEPRFGLQSLLVFIPVLAWSSCPCLGNAPEERLPIQVIEPITHSVYEAFLRVEPSQVSQGSTLKVECVVSSVNATGEVYNGFLNECLKLPAQIVFVSTDGNTRKSLLSPRGNAEKLESTQWLRLGSGTSIGREFSVSVSGVERGAPIKQGCDRVIDLPPGEYLVQLTYNHWLTSARPSFRESGELPRHDDAPREKLNWSVLDMDRAMLATKPVKLIVTAASNRSEDNVNKSVCPIVMDLRPSTVRAKFGRKADVEIRVINRSDHSVETFNPILAPLLRRSAIALAILDEQGTYLGNLNYRNAGSQRDLTTTDWVRLPPGGILSSRQEFVAGNLADPQRLGLQLPAGHYLVEARVNQHFIEPRPWDFALIERQRSIDSAKRAFGADVQVRTQYDINDRIQLENALSFGDWSRTFPGPEICRSNRVELEILPRTGD